MKVLYTIIDLVHDRKKIQTRLIQLLSLCFSCISTKTNSEFRTLWWQYQRLVKFTCFHFISGEKIKHMLVTVTATLPLELSFKTYVDLYFWLASMPWKASYCMQYKIHLPLHGIQGFLHNNLKLFFKSPYHQPNLPYTPYCHTWPLLFPTTSLHSHTAVPCLWCTVFMECPFLCSNLIYLSKLKSNIMTFMRNFLLSLQTEWITHHFDPLPLHFISTYLWSLLCFTF